MKTFNLFSLDGWVPVALGADIEFDTDEDVRNLEVTFNASDLVEVWAVDPDGERPDVLVAACGGLFVCKLALPSGMCLRVAGDSGVAVFLRSTARSQVMPPSCDPSHARPMPPRTQVDPRIKAMMATLRANEVVRQQAFEAMLARVPAPPVGGPPEPAPTAPAASPVASDDAS